MPIKTMKRTKIVATLGPASDNEEVLRQMILAGLDVVRINFSHSKPDYLIRLLELVRKVSRELNVPIAILGDLRGPRMRVEDIEGGAVELVTGQQIWLTPKMVMGTSERIAVSFPNLAADVQPGNIILLDDGDIELRVDRVEHSGDVLCNIVRGAKLSSHRGINLPGLRVNLPSLSEKDFNDINFAIEHKFDFLALSFVQTADDVRLLKAYLAAKQANIPVISKIEKKSALDDIEAIVRESYGVMVARGDLALEMSIQDVPIAQKRIIAVCRQAAKPVITATQMMESMIHMHKPTRAEATDVANAVLDGTDALMLSAETAIGKEPVEVIATMSRIALRAESAWMTGELVGPHELHPDKTIASNVAYVSQVVAKSLAASAIVTYTASGSTALQVSSHRPGIPILALTSHPETQRRLALTWGVKSALTTHIDDSTKMVEVAIAQAQICKVAKPGDTIVVTGSAYPHGMVGDTNSMKVERIPPQQLSL